MATPLPPNWEEELGRLRREQHRQPDERPTLQLPVPEPAPDDEPGLTPDDEPGLTPDDEPGLTPDDEPGLTPEDEPEESGEADFWVA